MLLPSMAAENADGTNIMEVGKIFAFLSYSFLMTVNFDI